MSIDQQTKGLRQGLFAGRGRLPAFNAHVAGDNRFRLRRIRRQQIQLEDQPLQRVAFCPANGLTNADCAPVRGFLLQNLSETQGKAPAGTFIAMHRTGKHHPRPAQQYGFQPLGRQTRRFINQDHFRLRPLRQQLLWRQKAQLMTGPGGQLSRRIHCQSITQFLPGVSEQGSHVIRRRRRHQHPFPA